VAPTRIAQGILAALARGIEQSCVGDVATDALTRWMADPALYTREKNL
jgi:hypothetical protein